MRIMKTILYATDYSESSRKALKYANELSKKNGSQIISLHVYEIPTIFDSPARYTNFEDIDRDVETNHRNNQHEFSKSCLGKDYSKRIKQFIAKEGKSPAKVILEMAEEYNADLIVIGTKGKSKAQRLIMGSTAIETIKKATSPVLTVPEESNYRPINKIVFASDFKEIEIKALNSLVEEIAQLFNAEIKVAHVSNGREYAIDEKVNWFKQLIKNHVDYDKIGFKLLKSNDVNKKLNEYIMQGETDMIAMLESEKDRLFDKLLNNNLLKKMEFQTTIPLLCYNKRFLNGYSLRVEKELEKLTQ